jgi:hypothetical protein
MARVQMASGDPPRWGFDPNSFAVKWVSDYYSVALAFLHTRAVISKYEEEKAVRDKARAIRSAGDVALIGTEEEFPSYGSAADGKPAAPLKIPFAKPVAAGLQPAGGQPAHISTLVGAAPVDLSRYDPLQLASDQRWIAEQSRGLGTTAATIAGGWGAFTFLRTEQHCTALHWRQPHCDCALRPYPVLLCCAVWIVLRRRPEVGPLQRVLLPLGVAVPIGFASFLWLDYRFKMEYLQRPTKLAFEARHFIRLKSPMHKAIANIRDQPITDPPESYRILSGR